MILQLKANPPGAGFFFALSLHEQPNKQKGQACRSDGRPPCLGCAAELPIKRIIEAKSSALATPPDVVSRRFRNRPTRETENLEGIWNSAQLLIER